MAPVVALIGCGRWGRNILRDLRSLGCAVPVVAISDAGRRAAREGGADPVIDAVSNMPPVDGIVVATPASTHADVLEQVLPVGVPVFVEKPMTVDPASAHRLAQSAPDRLFVMDKWRYHPGVELLASLAASEELGPVIGVRCLRWQWDVPQPDVDAIWTLASHDLAIAADLLGHPLEPVAAVADRQGSTPVGMTAFLGGSPWATIDVGARRPERIRQVSLICSGGIASLTDGWSDHLLVWRRADSADINRKPPEPLRRPFSTELPLLRELRAFVQHLLGGPPPRTSAREAADVVTTIASLRRLAGITEHDDR